MDTCPVAGKHVTSTSVTNHVKHKNLRIAYCPTDQILADSSSSGNKVPTVPTFDILLNMYDNNVYECVEGMSGGRAGESTDSNRTLPALSASNLRVPRQLTSWIEVTNRRHK
jgi:hypothetical protein